MTEQILRLPEVQERTGLSRSSIYAAIAVGTFPQQINIGHRSTGWISSEINTWIECKILTSRDNNKADKWGAS